MSVWDLTSATDIGSILERHLPCYMISRRAITLITHYVSPNDSFAGKGA